MTVYFSDKPSNHPNMKADDVLSFMLFSPNIGKNLFDI